MLPGGDIFGGGAAVSILRWPLIHCSPVPAESLIEITIFGAFGAMLLQAMVPALLPMRGARANRFSPLLPGLISLGIFAFVPFTQFYLKLNFAMNLKGRTAVAFGEFAEICERMTSR